MTLELSKLTDQVQAMGKELAARRHKYEQMVQLARRWLEQYADRGEQLRQPAYAVRAAIPTTEPLNFQGPLPPAPDRFTIIAADGSQIQPDRHGAILYYLINIGSLVYRHGSGEAPLAQSEPILGYAEEELYEDGLLLSGNLLDLRRDIAELTRLAELCTSESHRPVVALVDGTLLLWVLEERSEEWQRSQVMRYLDQLQRIQESGAVIAAFASRPRRSEVSRLLHLASVDGDAQRALREPNPLEHLPDRAIFETLPPGARSALFVSPALINHNFYRPLGQTVHFFYLNLAVAEERPVIARIEVPAWVAARADQLALVQAAIVAQARITGDYPYALARADELAFISAPEREALEEMITTSLMRTGIVVTPSPKAYYKTLTRSGRRRYGR
ncbi:MAG: DNA double-strand break repair nuclease NurA [Anaerolineae bacterium]|nr:DNA double-strand break repair nuclease NurA [Anaerolineae bacterium]